MMTETVTIGAGSGFWGDALDPAVELVESGRVQYLAMDYLAELTMALLQRQRMKDPDAGFIPDLLPHMAALLPPALENGTRIVCNAGGANPQAAAERLIELARERGLRIKIAVVEGDNLVDRLDEFLEQGIELSNIEKAGDDFSAIRDRVVAANAYIDSSGIIDALSQGADVVITGRTSDNALFVGPIMHELGWRHDETDPNHIGAAITVGHVAECAAACTGGMSSRWDEMPHMGYAGFPIVEFHADGTAIITKLPDTGGRVDEFTVKEHLVYEIADPSNYLMPDGVADFTTLSVSEIGKDRVRLTGMSGRPRPENLRVIVGYTDGWIGEGMLFFPWPNALGRARKARETLLERFDRLGLEADEVHFDFVGLNMLHGPAAPVPDEDPGLNEVGLRVAVHCQTREEAEKVRRACSQLWIMGPGGTSFGTPMKARPVVAVWPTLVPRDLVTQTVEILEA